MDCISWGRVIVAEHACVINKVPLEDGPSPSINMGQILRNRLNYAFIFVTNSTFVIKHFWWPIFPGKAKFLYDIAITMCYLDGGICIKYHAECCSAYLIIEADDFAVACFALVKTIKNGFW